MKKTSKKPYSYEEEEKRIIRNKLILRLSLMIVFGLLCCAGLIVAATVQTGPVAVIGMIVCIIGLVGACCIGLLYY